MSHRSTPKSPAAEVDNSGESAALASSRNRAAAGTIIQLLLLGTLFAAATVLIRHLLAGRRETKPPLEDLESLRSIAIPLPRPVESATTASK